MTTLSTKPCRNQTMECCKMLAAILVVFLHVPFPGLFGQLIDCMMRFSVPLFFAVSGYFSFGVRSDKMKRRLMHIIKLNIVAILAHVAWNVLHAAYQGESILRELRAILPPAKSLASWVFMHISPYSGQLWYLTAIAVCYAILWAYVTFFGEEKIDYRPLYGVSVVLFAIRFVAVDLMRTIGYGIPFFFCRDGFFFGLPMVSLGIFLREHQQRLFTNFRLTTKKLLGILLFGILLSLLQWKTYGTSELPLGALVQTFALMQLSLLHPRADMGSKAAAKLIGSFGYLSTSVYILHMIVSDAYSCFAQPAVKALAGRTESWLQPVIVLLGSIALSLLVKGLMHLSARLLPNLGKKKRSA